jgi:hypothetical protein
LTNTIFEVTRQAVLFQGKREVRRTDLTNPQHPADLLNHFYAYTEPEHEDFEKAVGEFQDRVPDPARGLADKIQAAYLAGGRGWSLRKPRSRSINVENLTGASEDSTPAG